MVLDVFCSIGAEHADTNRSSDRRRTQVFVIAGIKQFPAKTSKEGIHYYRGPSHFRGFSTEIMVVCTSFTPQLAQDLLAVSVPEASPFVLWILDLGGTQRDASQNYCSGYGSSAF